MHVHVQQPLRLGAGQGALGVLQVGDQTQAALIIGFPVERRTDVTRRPLQEWNAGRASGRYGVLS